MKRDVPANPVDVGLLRSTVVVPAPDCLPHPIEQLLAWTGVGTRSNHRCVDSIDRGGGREVEGHAWAHAGHDSGDA